MKLFIERPTFPPPPAVPEYDNDYEDDDNVDEINEDDNTIQ